MEGFQIWDLALRMAGQVRAVPGGILGWDFGAALALAGALEINPIVVAELLPALEAVMVRCMNERMKGGGDG